MRPHGGWLTLMTLIAVAAPFGGCAAPHDSIDGIIRRQSEAMKTLPEEDRARVLAPMPTPESAGSEPEAALPAGVLELEQARAIALQASPDVHAAQARLEAALARIGEARSFYFPQLTLVHSSTRTFLTPARGGNFNLPMLPTAIPDITGTLSIIDLINLLQAPLLGSTSFSTSRDSAFSQHTSVVSAAWTLFDGFVREARLMSAKYTYQAAAMSFANVQRLLVRAVDTAYYQAQLGREQVRIAEADEAFSREQLADAETRFAAQKITKADVLNFEVRVRAAQANVAEAIGLRDMGRVLLAELLALAGAKLPDHVDLAPLDPETEEDLTAPDEEVWVDRAVQARPDMAQARHTLSARQENINLAKGQFSPALNMTGNYGFDKTSNMGYSDDDQTAAVALEMRWQLFTGGFRTAQVRRAQAEWWEASADLERKRLEVAADARAAIVDLINAQERVRLQRVNLESARENRRLVQIEYAAGKASVVRLNEAQRDYVNTDGELTRARIRLRQAWTDLRAAAAAQGPTNGTEGGAQP